jgi:hypothetical protein
MRTWLAACAIGEALTGLTLVADPPLVIVLLFGVEPSGVGVIVGRLAGMALIGLGCACWPGRNATTAAVSGMCAYNSTAAIYLMVLGVDGEWVGPLLWPALLVHAIVSLALGRALLEGLRGGRRSRAFEGTTHGGA